MNNSSTFYLKYRPQKIVELDLKDIREQLAKVLSSSRVSHAFLFSGPKGLGKTSAARILAKAVNCIGKKKSFEPCNKCQICKSITQGTNLDLIEIDAASNRGIDDIRGLRQNIRLTPNQAKKKVYVIDEVHMLTPEAFNALLKTLEEPPAHVLFVLCTTEVHKLPETIISRCQHFRFRLATIEELIRSLKRIIRGEKLTLANTVLEEISRHAEGSFRDATKNLEMLVSLYGKRISLKQAKDFFGQEAALAKDLLARLAKKDISQALLWLDQAIKNGVDLKTLITAILEDLRKILLHKHGILDEKIDDYGFEVEQIKELIFLIDQAGRQLKGAVLPQLPLELAIVEWGKDKKVKVKKSHKNLDLDFILEKWPEVLEKVKLGNHSVEALLKASQPIKVKKDKLIIEVFYSFHKGKLGMENCLQLVEEKLKEVFSLPLKVKYVLSKKTKGGESSA